MIRVIRTVPWLKKLRTMVFATMNSFGSLLWAFALIVLMVYCFGLIFQNAITTYVVEASTDEEIETAKEMRVHFGSLGDTMLSLWCSISGGNDWMAYGELIRKTQNGDIYILIYCFYVAFAIIGLMNVVTGIFVDSAVCTRTEDEVVECFKADQRRTQNEARRIFMDADQNHDGLMTLLELEQHLADPWVKAYFSGLDMDPSEAKSMFTIMDVDHDGAVNVDEFVDGCMRLKGHAKTIDVMSMMYDLATANEKFSQLFLSIGNQLHTIERHLSLGSPVYAKTATDLL